MTTKPGRHPVTLVGQVRAVTLHDDAAAGGGACRLRLDDGATITADFADEHLPGIAMALLYHADRRLKITGLGEFGPDGSIKRILQIETQEPEHASPPLPFDTAKLTISELFIAAGTLLPEDELAKFPPDFSENMEHYMYGAPRQDDEE